jgi:hypothetical protein
MGRMGRFRKRRSRKDALAINLINWQPQLKYDIPANIQVGQRCAGTIVERRFVSVVKRCNAS